MYMAAFWASSLKNRQCTPKPGDGPLFTYYNFVCMLAVMRACTAGFGAGLQTVSRNAEKGLPNEPQ